MRIKVNEIWRKRHNQESMQLFGDSVVLSFVRTSQVSVMDIRRNVSHVFKGNPQESDPKTCG